MQIDAVRIQDNTAVCNLYTGDRCIRIIMTASDYESLKRDGFLLRKKDSEDSAGMINTTAEYEKVVYENGHKKLAPVSY